MRDYKGFTDKERRANLYLVKKAIKNGELAHPCTLPCEICGQDKGIREWHCEDYTPERAMQSLHCYCWRCHRNYHIIEVGEEHKKYKYAKFYFDKVAEGMIFKPVYMKHYTREMEQELNK